MNKTSKIIITILSVILLIVLFLLWDQHRIRQVEEERLREMTKLMQTHEPINTEPKDVPPTELNPVNDDNSTEQKPQPTPNLPPKEEVKPSPVQIGANAKATVSRQAPGAFQQELNKVADGSTYSYVSIKFQGEPFRENDTVSYPVTLRFKINGTNVYYNCESTEISYDLRNGKVEAYVPEACFIP